MDLIPSETHAAEVEATVDDLERGLASFPLSKAVNRIDDWKREIEATGRDDLQPLADGLGELRASLVGEGRDVATIGGLLVRLGEQTEEAAGLAAESLRPKLLRLGSILRSAGGALRGPGGSAEPAAET